MQYSCVKCRRSTLSTLQLGQVSHKQLLPRRKTGCSVVLALKVVGPTQLKTIYNVSKPHAINLETFGICDPLSENPAHPAFYENRDKTGNRCIDVQLSIIEKMETIGCLVPELRSETHRGRGTQVCEKMQCFYVVMVNCNVSVYYRVT